MHGFFQDVRHGMRLLLRTPGFTVIAVLTLALGIGANTAVFSMLRSTLVSMFGPVPRPSRVVRIWARNLTGDTARMQMSIPDFESVRAQSRSFSGVAAWTGVSWLLDFGHGPARISGARVSPDFFRVLGFRPALGNDFAGDAQSGPTIAIVSYRLWKETYSSDPAILGRSVNIEDASHSIVGVMPEKFWYQSRGVDVWVPLSQPAPGWNRVERGYNVFGRLQPGVSEQQAEAELTTISQRLQREFPASNAGWTFVPISLWHEQMKRAGMTGVFLFGPVLFVLLIACANVGTMLLARASVRRGEIAVRAALGGSRARLVRQLLTESLLLSFGGALAGFAFAAAGIRICAALLPASAADVSSVVHVDLSMFVFALVVALLTAVLFGLSPALAATRLDLNSALKERESSGASRSRLRSRERLIAWQVGLAVIFVVITAAFGRGIAHIEQTAARAGFEARNLITFDITSSPRRFRTPEQIAAYHRDLQTRIEAVPGVQSAGASTFLPVLSRQGTRPVTLDPANVPESNSFAVQAVVTPGFFQSARIPVRRGRDIGPQDTPKALPVACVNETFARRYWPKQDVIGKHVRFGADDPWLTVVGVVADTVDDPVLGTTMPYLFVPHAQHPARTMVFVVRPAGDPAAVVPAIRRAVWDFDREQDLDEVATAQQLLDDTFRGAWMAVSIMGTFALIGLLLAATGVYGIMSFITAQRTREVGVRLALGASPKQILRQVVSRGAVRIVLGLGVGLLISASFLFVFHRNGTSGDAALLRPSDPLPYAMAAAALAAAALLGAYVPARRASKVDPMVALRYE